MRPVQHTLFGHPTQKTLSKDFDDLTGWSRMQQSPVIPGFSGPSSYGPGTS